MSRPEIYNKPTPSAALVFARNPVAFKAAEDGKRLFDAVGYSGDVLERHWYWERVIFDMSSTKVPNVIPVLLSHDEDKIAGVTASAVTGNDGIRFTGNLYADEESGARVAKLADDGFPWQMSIRIHPNEVLYLEEGFTQNINGREVSGPIFVFRDSEVSEVSFTPVGADSKTSVRVFNRAEGDFAQLNFSTKEGDSTMTPQEEKDLRDRTERAEASALVATTAAAASKEALDAANASVKVVTFSARKASLTTHFTRLGMAAPTDDLVEGYMGMTDAQFNVATSSFAAAKPIGTTGTLFQQTATGPKDGEGAGEGAENPVVKFSRQRAEQMSKTVTKEMLINGR